jgi:hypothetical protein
MLDNDQANILSCAACGYGATVTVAAGDGTAMTVQEYLALCEMAGYVVLCEDCAVARPGNTPTP